MRSPCTALAPRTYRLSTYGSCGYKRRAATGVMWAWRAHGHRGVEERHSCQLPAHITDPTLYVLLYVAILENMNDSCALDLFGPDEYGFSEIQLYLHLGHDLGIPTFITHDIERSCIWWVVG